MNNTNHILLPTDLSDESTSAFDTVARLAQKLGARVTVMHVVESPVVAMSVGGAPVPQPDISSDKAKFAHDRLTALCDRLPDALEVSHELDDSGPASDAILERAKTLHVDMIAMPTHGRRGLERLILGSTAEAVLRRTDVPLLLIPKEG